MASSGPYGDADAPLGGSAGMYVGQQNGGTPPAQQQHTDADMQLHQSMQQLRQGTELMQQGPPQQHQMDALTAAHHHFQTPQRPTHSPQHMAQSAQSVMGLEDPNVYGDHDSASRKRSKVSRACDECRRKKIRCDATNDGPESCSSCKRTGAPCRFSRQPMKRGPSKGYIKELADRLINLEHQIGTNAPSQAYDFSSVNDQVLAEAQAQAQAQTPSQMPRKRTHSMSENFADSYGRQNWAGHERVQEQPPNGAATHDNRRASFGDMSLAGSLITGSNETAIKAYYTVIHPSLRLLPQDSSPLNRLTHCPSKLREAFFVSLECSIRTFASGALPPIDIAPVQLIHQCFEVVDAAKHFLNDQDSSQHFFNRLVYCQSLVFLILASDRPGPSTIGSTAELLGRLAGCINETGLNDAKVISTLREHDHEVFQAARRTFWIAFILDRFYAASRDKNTLLSPHSGSVSREDFEALGDLGYHLARAADIIGQVVFITRAARVPNMDSSPPNTFAALTATLPATQYLNGQLARFRESLDISPLHANELPFLAYHYLRIYIAQQSEHTASTELLSLTQNLLGLLINSTPTPLHHIFASLVATSLTNLSDRVETQVEAHASIKEMGDALSKGQIIHRSIDGLGWDIALRDLLHQKKAATPPNALPEQTSPAPQPDMAGLQHLAEAAVGEREGDAKPSAATNNNPSIDHDLKAAMAAASEAAAAQAAQATAALAEEQLQNVPEEGNSNNNGNNYESALNKDGFMASLA
ncbi:hypothetical protein P280DRAFT_396283 [Massarina eburnea CBS 473.64]|uniref:Zn(2)-C6 fungal-type domain-containing protein n=1 Tax=Massarina eburnea CBS 473.64 TaxID=1395130 RepID=A0A6A6S7U1_9PLEO|nr:hypothetical protein P280DRAFT_396283 [Massarina eburnea CBS 473.64]